MSTLHRHPRQDRRNVGRSPVKLARSSKNRKCKAAQLSAALATSRAKNKAGRPPLN